MLKGYTNINVVLVYVINGSHFLVSRIFDGGIIEKEQWGLTKPREGGGGVNWCKIKSSKTEF